MLIRSGEAPEIGWSRNMLYSGFNIFPRSVFWLADLNGRSDNTDVIRLNERSPMAKQSYLKYGIAALLSVTAVAASMLAGYQNGFAVGESDGFDSRIVTVSYPVGPLVIAPDGAANYKPDYSSLINLITSTVSPDTWKNPDTSIEALTSSQILAVAQTARVHAQVEDMLNKLNEGGLPELYDHRYKNKLCLQCGHGIFTKPKTIAPGTKSYAPECGRCGRTANWGVPVNNTNETRTVADPAG